jgi:Rieske Fe-S protein
MQSRITGRRHFLQMVSCATAGTAVLGSGVLACGSDGDEGQAAASGPIPAGSVSDVAVGSLQGVGDQPVAIGRDARGLYALSTICTHQACNIRKSGSVSANGLACNCHGSRYDANGSVTNGPAPRSLDHYKVELAPDGSIIIQGGQIVPQDERVAVP